MRATRTKQSVAAPAQTAPAITTPTATYTPAANVAAPKTPRASRNSKAAAAQVASAPVAPVAPPTGHIQPAAKTAKSTTPANRRRKPHVRIPADAIAFATANPSLATDGLTAAAAIQRTFDAKRMPAIFDATAKPGESGYLGVAFVRSSVHMVDGKPVELLTAHCRPYNAATGTYSATARHRMIPLAALLVLFDKPMADPSSLVTTVIYTGLSAAKIAAGMTIGSAYQADCEAELA